MDDLKYNPIRVRNATTEVPKTPNSPYVDPFPFPQTAHVLVVKIAEQVSIKILVGLSVRTHLLQNIDL